MFQILVQSLEMNRNIGLDPNYSFKTNYNDYPLGNESRVPNRSTLYTVIYSGSVVMRTC